MKKQFNPKEYRGKDRIYTPVPNAPRISKFWIWDPEAFEYRPPREGKPFLARRYEHLLDKVERKSAFFHTLGEARTWQSTSEKQKPSSIAINRDQSNEISTKPQGRRLGEIVQEWRRRMYPSFATTTQVAYDKLAKLYLSELFDLTIYELTPARIDEWIDWLKDPKGRAMQSTRRKTFRHELELLSGILRYYDEYSDDPEFRFPIKHRHHEAIELNRPYDPVSKDLSEEEFALFREELSKLRHGEILAPMATVQFYQALRISEAAGLFHEDATLDRRFPHNSRLKVVRAVCWPRERSMPSYIKGGFKNSKANQGIKEHPMFPETFLALDPICPPGAKGLVFQLDGKHLEYRQIQYAYDQAFKRAGLPYSATHVMRHGGCRRLFNQTGDISIAQQHLGNRDMQSVQVYARRQASALTKVVQADWERKYAETGCKWLHPNIEKEKAPQLRETLS